MPNLHRSEESSPLVEFREESRLSLLKNLDLGLLRKDGELQQIVERAREICSAPMAHASVVDENEQIVLASTGFNRDVIPIRWSFCKTALEMHRILIVEDATRDPRFCDNTLVTGPMHLRFYVGIPILIGRRIPVATLCVMNTEPRRLRVRERAELFGLVNRIETQIEHYVDQHTLDHVLRKTAELARRESKRIQQTKDVMVSHLLHDLINKVSCIKSDAQFARTDSDVADEAADALNDIESCISDVAQTLGEVRHIVLHEEGALPCNERIVVSKLLEELRPLCSDLVTIRNDVGSDLVWGHPKLVRDLMLSLCQYARGQISEDEKATISVVGLDHDRRGRRTQPESEGTLAEVSAVPDVLEFCRMIARAHGGRVVEQSHGATGDMFSVELPEVING